MSSSCLNCTKLTTEKYCPNCGQKASTHRYSIQHFIEHDFIHGVFHVDKGILFTLKELFTRPGHSIREYIQGKRATHFSFITFLLLIITITALMAPYSRLRISDLIPVSSKAVMNSFETFTTQYPKVMLAITIPINSLFSYLWFRKAKFNYSEHLVANSYKAVAELIISLLFAVLMIVYTNIKVLMVIYFGVMTPLIYIYDIWYYYQMFSIYYKTKKEVFLRSFMVVFSYTMLIVFIGMFFGIMEALKK